MSRATAYRLPSGAGFKREIVDTSLVEEHLSSPAEVSEEGAIYVGTPGAERRPAEEPGYVEGRSGGARKTLLRCEATGAAAQTPDREVVSVSPPNGPPSIAVTVMVSLVTTNGPHE